MTRSPRSRRLGGEFFARSAPAVARDLLGCLLVHQTAQGLCSGRIVETEAYLAEGDPASHSHAGRTSRNASMFERPGVAYVYRIYGVHCCFNVSTGREGRGEAVLVRALEPLRGLELQRRRRGALDPRALCSGPGKLVQALGLGLEHDGRSLLSGPLGIWCDDHDVGDVEITARIGITKARDLPLRFVVRASPFVSRRSAMRAR
ncbi:MAG: DNA-3-methyladenine glycosylase [Planctomycetes bacterium]|nr:DNA-3-methyladenine glycosylase [Planctomycetota bacterium]